MAAPPAAQARPPGTGGPRCRPAAMSAGWQAPWRALGALGRELAAEWAAQDVRAALCQLLLLWLGLSLLGVRLAWRAYGGAVAALCYRTGPAARRSPGTASGPGDGLATEPGKTHRE
uniref:T-cell leukemia translocation-altered gene protein homolog n=1 Tax=Strigops habroptila TaxID=2489341 RepID=A0A672UY41_STRHB